MLIRYIQSTQSIWAVDGPCEAIYSLQKGEFVLRGDDALEKAVLLEALNILEWEVI